MQNTKFDIPPYQTTDDSEVIAYQVPMPENKYYLLSVQFGINNDTYTKVCMGKIKSLFMRGNSGDIVILPISDNVVDGNFGDSSLEQQPQVRFFVDNENYILYVATKGLVGENLSHAVSVLLTTDTF